MQKIITQNAKQTQHFGQKIAREILDTLPGKRAVVLGLQGNLGGGKTTFLQGFAKGLGIKEKILSPTFVILKRFEVSGFRFKNFYHVDCYRLKDEKDILELGWKDIISDSRNVVAVEWSEKIEKILPQDTIFIKFTCLEPCQGVDAKKRELTIKKQNSNFR